MKANKKNISKQTQKPSIGPAPDLPPGVTSVIPGGCFPMSLYGGLAKEACRLLREGKSASEAKAILDAQYEERVRVITERVKATTRTLATAQPPDSRD